MGAGAHPAYPYINGLEHEKIGLEITLWQLRAIRKNAPGVSDENVMKMYGAEK